MGRESPGFQKLFLALMVLDGSPDELFDMRQPEKYEPRLLRVQMIADQKGKRAPVVREVALSAKRLNSKETFIYDGGLTILIWHGREVTAHEKIAAQNVSQVLFDQRSGRTRREYVNQGIDNENEWFQLLGGRTDIASEPETVAPIPVGVKRLMKITDASGDISMQEIAMADRLSVTFLDSKDAFLLDDGLEVMVWIGAEASVGERRDALNFAVQYLVKYGRPLEAPLSRFLEGHETEQFLNAFPDGQSAGLFKQRGLSHRQSKAYRTLKRDPSLSKLIAKSKGRTAAEDLFAHLDRSMPRPEADGNEADDDALRGSASPDASPDAPAAKAPSPAPEAQVAVAGAATDVKGDATPQEPVAAAAPENTASVEAPAGDADNGNGGAKPEGAVVEEAPAPVEKAPDAAQTPPGGEATQAPGNAAAAETQAEPAVAPASEGEQATQAAQPSGEDVGQACVADAKKCPVFHGAISKANADALLKADLTSGRHLIRSFGGGANHKLILGVVYKEKPSHHLLQKEPDHTYTVNGKRTELSRLADVLAFLTTKRPWWPVPLTTGIPLAP